MMKKTVATFLLLFLALSLSACGGGGVSTGTEGTDPGMTTDIARNSEEAVGKYPVIPETDLSPEEFIAQNYQNLLQHGDGGWTAKIYYQGYHVLAPTFLPLDALEGEWESVGVTKTPVYPWEKREEDLVTNCTPADCEVYVRNEEYRTLIAILVDGKYYVFQ